MPRFVWCNVANLRSVLVVDDDELLARMISELLLREGYEVCAARDGLQGYSSYRQSQTEIVVTDIEMPQLDGFEMMRGIRTINPAVKAIYISGALGQYRRTLIMESQKFGAVALGKPFVGMDLLNTLAGEMPAFVRYEWPRNERKLVWKEAG